MGDVDEARALLACAAACAVAARVVAWLARVVESLAVLAAAWAAGTVLARTEAARVGGTPAPADRPT